jgi:hypothetical protein
MTSKTFRSDAVRESVPSDYVDQSTQRTPSGGLVSVPADEIGLATPKKAPNPAPMSSVDIYLLIQETAYYKAEARGFSPGYEEQDWLEAEAQIKARLGVRTSASE